MTERVESYVVGVGDSDAPALNWQTSEPVLQLSADAVSAMRATQIGQPVWVRQVGTFGLSEPLLLHLVA